MVMQSKWLIIGMAIVLSLILFLLGMIGYAGTMDFIVAGNVSPKLHFVFENQAAHKLLSASALAISGLVIGAAALWSSRNGALKRCMVAFLLLTLVALATMFIKLFFMRYAINSYSQSLSEITLVNFPIQNIHLYEMSLYACVIVIILASVIRWVNGRL